MDLKKIAAERLEKRGEEKTPSIEDMRKFDYEEMIKDTIRNRGKMSMSDLYLLHMMERDREQPGQKADHIEEIIRKVTDPLNKQIEEMKKEKEQEALLRRLDRLETMMIEGKGKNKDEDSDTMKELKEIRKSLLDKEKTEEKTDRERFERSIRGAMEGLNEKILNIGHNDNLERKDKIQQILEVEREKKELLSALGVSQNKEDEASTMDMLNTGLDMFTSKAPAIMKTVNTVREGFKGGEDLPDDIPDDYIPTELPSRSTVPASNTSSVPEDILAFLDLGHTDKDGGFVDLSDVKWTNSITNEPLTRASIERKAITQPEDVRTLMHEAYDSVKPASKKEPLYDKTDDYETDDLPDEPAEDMPETVEKPMPARDKIDSDKSLEEALAYVRSGTEKTDANGVTMWVGDKGEVYSEGDKSLLTADLEKEARANPKAFLADVKAHIASLE